MRWLIQLTPPDGPPVRAAGRAGGICTTRAHCAAAIAALARDTAPRDTPLKITVVMGRRTNTFTAPARALHDVQTLVACLRDLHALSRASRYSK